MRSSRREQYGGTSRPLLAYSACVGSILILGGTAEARELANRLDAVGVPVVTSLAGRTPTPRLPAGRVRVGGFGGPDGLAAWLRQEGVSFVVDATHPYAEQMSRHAVLGCAAAGVALLRLDRPGWRDHPAAGTWHWVDEHAAAAKAAAEVARAADAERAGATARDPRPTGAVLLTIGRQNLPTYIARLADRNVLARVADDTGLALPPRWRTLPLDPRAEPAAELALFAAHDVTVLVTKDAGGRHTAAKLDAAARLDVPVIVVRRPAAPPGIDTVTEMDDALARCLDASGTARS